MLPVSLISRIRDLPAPRGKERWVSMLAGCPVLALGIATALSVDVGIGPYDVLIDGVSHQLGLTFGIASYLVGVLTIGLGWGLGAQVGPGSLITLVVVGPLVDAWGLLLPDLSGEALAVALFPVSVLLIGIGVTMVVSARLGTGAMDILMLGLMRHGLPLRSTRTALEVSVCLLGWALGGALGAGTLVIAVSIGPIVGLLLPREVAVAVSTPPASSR